MKERIITKTALNGRVYNKKKLVKRQNKMERCCPKKFSADTGYMRMEKER